MIEDGNWDEVAYVVIEPQSHNMDNLAASFATKREFEQGECVLTYDRLDVDSIVKSVSNDSTGATAVFIGTTRNTFQG